MRNFEIRISNSNISLVRDFNGRMAIRALILCATFLFAISPGRVLLAQIAAEDSPSVAEPSEQFPGTYIFEWPEGRCIAGVQINTSVFTAKLEITGGYTIQLIGTAQGNSAQGMIVGKSVTDSAGEFEASIDGDTLQITMTTKETGEPLQFIFNRVGSTEQATADQPSNNDPSVDMSEAPTESTVPDQPSTLAGAGGDERLIGTWVYQSLITSGDSSFASESFQTFRADGSYSYGKGDTVAGGGGWSYDAGNGNGDAENGFWRAQDGILYTSGADGQWYRLGKYGMTEDGSTMRITYDNGNKKLWNRR